MLDSVSQHRLAFPCLPFYGFLVTQLVLEKHLWPSPPFWTVVSLDRKLDQLPAVILRYARPEAAGATGFCPVREFLGSEFNTTAMRADANLSFHLLHLSKVNQNYQLQLERRLDVLPFAEGNDPVIDSISEADGYPPLVPLSRPKILLPHAVMRLNGLGLDPTGPLLFPTAVGSHLYRRA